MSQPDRSVKKRAESRSRATPARGRKPVAKDPSLPHDYAAVLSDLKQLIAAARRRALATVNRELVGLYWQVGRTIVERQQQAEWGDGVVEQLSQDLRLAFPDFAGLTSDNLWRMRKFYISCEDVDRWLNGPVTAPALLRGVFPGGKLGTVCPEKPSGKQGRQVASAPASPDWENVGTLSPQIRNAELRRLVESLSWSHHRTILGAAERPDERYFYLAMAVRERWSVRELRRQIDSALFLRYVSVKSKPENCLPDDTESGDLLPFKDHYILEFLGLEDEHTERELRQTILANLRDFFLEFGRDLTFVGEEFAITVGNDTFYIDLLFFNRRLQCLLAVDLKIGKFKPEYVGKSQFYCAALDEQVKLAHENPSIGLVLCKTADSAQVRLALTAAARKIGVATYQTALPDEKLIRQRLEQLPAPTEETQR